jgi:hypothetical protein
MHGKVFLKPEREARLNADDFAWTLRAGYQPKSSPSETGAGNSGDDSNSSDQASLGPASLNGNEEPKSEERCCPLCCVIPSVVGQPPTSANHLLCTLIVLGGDETIAMLSLCGAATLEAIAVIQVHNLRCLNCLQ